MWNLPAGLPNRHQAPDVLHRRTSGHSLPLHHFHVIDGRCHYVARQLSTRYVIPPKYFKAGENLQDLTSRVEMPDTLVFLAEQVVSPPPAVFAFAKQIVTIGCQTGIEKATRFQNAMDL